VGDRGFLDKCLRHSRRLEKPMHHYAEAGPRIKPIRPEYVTAPLSEVADADALFFADTGTATIWAARTEVQRKMSVVHIILNNSMLDFVNIEQEEAGLIPFGTALENPDFARVAEAMGARGIRVEEPGEVRDALKRALAHSGGPTVVDIVVEKFALALPAHIPLHTATGFTLSMARQVLKGHAPDVAENIRKNIGLL